MIAPDFVCSPACVQKTCAKKARSKAGVPRWGKATSDYDDDNKLLHLHSSEHSGGQFLREAPLERLTVRIEQMAMIGGRAHFQRFAALVPFERRNACDQTVGRGRAFGVEIGRVAERFDRHRLRAHAALRHAHVQMLGPDAHGHLVAFARAARLHRDLLRFAAVVTHDDAVTRDLRDRAFEKVHLRRADETRDEAVRRRVIEPVRRADLLDVARREHDDLVRERHRLDLIVRHVDHRGLQFVVQAREFEAHLHAQRGVEVRERFVEQKHLGLARDRPPDRHALTLTARKLLGLAIEQMVDVQDLRGVLHGRVDLGLLRARELEAERHVVVQRHVRIKRIRLEHHRDAALGGRHVVHARAVDRQVAATDVFETGDHPHQRGLAAAARADEHDELAITDIEVHVAQHFGFVVALEHVSQDHACHDVSPFVAAAGASSHPPRLHS
ncbi:hypothetical protein PT2222_270114 [Paraburkholderia tropica]